MDKLWYSQTMKYPSAKNLILFIAFIFGLSVPKHMKEPYIHITKERQTLQLYCTL